jgi:hypothetical protein
MPVTCILDFFDLWVDHLSYSSLYTDSVKDYLSVPFLSIKGKGKVVPLFFNWTPRHECVLEEWRYSSTHSWPRHYIEVSKLARRFTPRERAPDTYWIGSWMSPRAGLDAVVKRKIPSPYRDSNPRSPVCSPVLYHWAIPAYTVPEYIVCVLPEWSTTWIVVRRLVRKL